MRDKKIIPVFNSEAEEAQWWFDNRETFDQDLKEAFANGTAGVGTVARRMQNRALSVDLDPADIALAKKLAERKGVDYQTFLRNLFHEVIERELALHNAESQSPKATQAA